MRGIRTILRSLCMACIGLAGTAVAMDLPEHQLKAAFLYNFALFTEWPADTGPSITLCVIDGEALLNELEEFQGQAVGTRHFFVRRIGDADMTQGCQIVFLAKAAPALMSRTMRRLAGNRHLLVVGDSPEAGKAGVGINMAIHDAHVIFDVNLKAVQDSGLTLSSKLLRLARHVR